RRGPRDLDRLLARPAVRGSHRGLGEGGRCRRAHVAAEHGRRPSSLLLGSGRPQGLRTVRPSRLRYVEGLCRRSRPAVARDLHLRGRPPRGGPGAARKVPAMGPGQRHARGRTRVADLLRRPPIRAERPMPRSDLVEDGHGGRLPRVHAIRAGRRRGGRGEVPPGKRGRLRRRGRREIGPNAVPVSGPYTYRGFFDSPKELSSKLLEVPLRNKLQLLVNPDFVALAAEEGASSVSKRVMAKRAQEFLPSLRVQYLVRPGTAGVRASVVDRSGNFVKEAIELPGPHSYHITNYNSPVATGAP